MKSLQEELNKYISDWLYTKSDDLAEELAKDLNSIIVQDRDSKTCEWEERKKYDEYGVYDTSCNNTQYFSDGGIKENEYKYCPYCGKRIVDAENRHTKTKYKAFRE